VKDHGASREPFRMTRRSLSPDGRLEVVIEAAPDAVAVPAQWLVEQMGLAALFIGNRISNDLGAGLVCTDWPLALLKRSISERWYERDSLAAVIRAKPGWTRPGDYVAAGERDQAIAARNDARAEAGLPVPHAYSFTSGGTVGFVTVSRERALEPREEAVIEFYGPALFRVFLDHARQRVSASITERERECLDWTAKGKTAQETADILGVSVHTVVAHLKSVGNKLGTQNRTHAVAEALRLGLIEYG